MSEAVSIDKIHDELEALRKDVEYLKKNMVDPDRVMTEEDYLALLEYRKEKKKDMLISEKKLKSELFKTGIEVLEEC